MALKDAAYARDIVASLERETKSKSARKRMAELAIAQGKYDEAGKAVFVEYLKTFG